jgi:hypothetical protein
MHTRASLFLGLRIATVFCIATSLGVTVGAAPKKAASKPLTVRQLEHLIRQKSPDGLISMELLSRGLAGPVGRPLIDKLQQLGAGPQTVSALLHLLPKVKLTIRTVPGALAALDGAPVATAGESGEIVLAIEPGNYELRVTMPHHNSVSIPVRLALDHPQVVQAPLEWTIGYLTLDTGSPDAKITIASVGEYQGRVEKLPVPVGPHQVHVTAPFRIGFSTVAVIEGGKTRDIPVRLEPDANAFEALSTEIQRSYANSDYMNAIAKGMAYVRHGGADPQALVAFALSQYQAGGFDAFLAIGAKALAAGAELTFPVNHRHSTLAFRRGHPAIIGVSATSVRYEPLEKCGTGPVSGPIAQVRCSISSSEDSSTLTLVFPHPKHPTKTLELNFEGPEPAKLEAIMRLIELLRTPAH